jgi:endo-1,4-beta-xylanase
MRKRWIVLGVLVVLALLAGCAVGNEAPEQAASAEQPAEPARAEQAEWVVVEGGEDLTEHGTWPCAGPVKVEENGLVVPAGSDYVTVLHEQGPVVEVDGDFGLRARMSLMPSSGSAFFVACGALPEGEWWEGVKRLEYGLAPGGVSVLFWDGKTSQPAYSKTHAVPDLKGTTELEFRRVGDQLVFYVNGSEVAQMADPGAFPENRFYLGANVPPGNLLTIEQLTVLASPGREGAVRVLDPDQLAVPALDGKALRELAAERGLGIGAAVAANPILCEPAYAEVLKREFNMLATENALKFGPVHPAPDRYEWSGADAIVEYAEANDMLVRGHTLVWHHQLPAWVEKGTWTREELMAVLEDHIQTVVGRYRGRIAAWDVVNEALDDEGELRDTIWLRVIGPEYIEMAFRWAHEADPDALLFYNDYACEAMGCKSDAVYALVQELQEKGVPIDGVGLQMHVQLGQAPALPAVRRNLKRLGDLGLEVHITEMDVRLRDTEPDTLARQAAIYGETLKVCLEAESCTAFVLWGFTDRHSWIPGAFKGWDDALIFDDGYAPKPAYEEICGVLAQ